MVREILTTIWKSSPANNRLINRAIPESRTADDKSSAPPTCSKSKREREWEYLDTEDNKVSILTSSKNFTSRSGKLLSLPTLSAKLLRLYPEKCLIPDQTTKTLEKNEARAALKSRPPHPSVSITTPLRHIKYTFPCIGLILLLYIVVTN